MIELCSLFNSLLDMVERLGLRYNDLILEGEKI